MKLKWTKAGGGLGTKTFFLLACHCSPIAETQDSGFRSKREIFTVADSSHYNLKVIRERD